MATQTDVQQLIQSLVPSGVNNGNPNTIYNVPPPSLDAQGNWAQGRLPQAASIPGLNLPAILAQLPQSNWGSGPSAGPPAGPILPTFPAPGGGGGGGGGGGYVPPVTPPGTGGPQPPVQVPGGGGGGGELPRFPSDPLTNLQGQAWFQIPGNLGGAGAWAGMPGGGGGGTGGGSGFGWQNVIDGVANLFGVDPYMQGTGQWNIKGAIGDVISQMLGVPLNQLGQKFGIGGMNNMIGDYFFEQNMRDAQDKMGRTQQKINKQTMAQVQADIEKILERMSGGNSDTGGGGRDGRSGQSAGSNVIAEGKAAQDMVGAMQLQNFLNGLAAQARNQSNPRYQMER